MHLEQLDLIVVGIYAVSLLFLAQWVSREKAGHEKDTRDYFLAGRALPWWAIGASLIAANISAEQIIGMSGSAYVLGIAIAAYEWMAAITLISVGKYLLPVFHAGPTTRTPRSTRGSLQSPGGWLPTTCGSGPLPRPNQPRPSEISLSAPLRRFVVDFATKPRESSRVRHCFVTVAP